MENVAIAYAVITVLGALFMIEWMHRRFTNND